MLINLILNLQAYISVLNRTRNGFGLMYIPVGVREHACMYSIDFFKWHIVIYIRVKQLMKVNSTNQSIVIREPCGKCAFKDVSIKVLRDHIEYLRSKKKA